MSGWNTMTVLMVTGVVMCGCLHETSVLAPDPDATPTECQGAATGTPCGDLQATACSMPDTCDGEGNCVPNHMAPDAPCGGDVSDMCDAPDRCDGEGACMVNHKADDEMCTGCDAGAGLCECAAGACVAMCSSNACMVDEDCSSATTGETCSDGMCVGASPSGPFVTADVSDWQMDTESAEGGPLWYCNAAVPVPVDGVLTQWTIRVALGGDIDDTTRLAVIRCGGGGGGDGPVLSGCYRVGIGPAGQALVGNGKNKFSLKGSMSNGGAGDDGIVVKAGDHLCANVSSFQIGMDFNGSAEAGDTPSDFDTQAKLNLLAQEEPFDLDNPSPDPDRDHDGFLMLQASGTSDPIAGTCED